MMPKKSPKAYPTIEAATASVERRLGTKAASWTYENADGETVGVVVRWNVADGTKEYRPVSRRDDGDGWVIRAMPKPRPLYALPTLAEADRIFIVEGEKSADALRELGIAATTSAGACNAAKATDWSPLAGKRCVIWPDNDDGGERYADDVARLLTKHAPGTTVTRIEPPEIIASEKGGDVADFVAAYRQDGLTDDDIRAKIEQLATDSQTFEPDESDDDDDSDDKPQPRFTQSKMLLDLAAAEGVILWHDRDGRAYGTIEVNDHAEHFEIKTKAFRRWLARLYYVNCQSAPGAQALQDALCAMEGMAVFEGAEFPVFVRYASIDGVIYIDLADDKWQAIKVTADGWSIVAEPPVKFRRARGMLPLPVPVEGGDLADLRRFINYGTDAQFTLIVAWLIGCYMPSGPYPVLEMDGEQGSAKSTAGRMLRRLVDPNEADLRSAPREERDLLIAARNGHIIGFDNLSGCHPWLSDALCRLATGAGFSTRELYSDGEEMIFSGARPIIVNGIGGVATRSDLLDRTIRVMLPTIQDRKDERGLWADFTNAHAAILGAILDSVVVALGQLDSVKLDDLPRMADFARWIVAAESVLPWKPGAFMTTYAKSRHQADRDAIDASAIGPAIVALLDRTYAGFEGSPSELLERLREQATVTDSSNRTTDPVKSIKGWPKRANDLGGQVKRIAPNLRACGYTVELDGRDATGRTYRLIAPIAEPE